MYRYLLALLLSLILPACDLAHDASSAPVMTCTAAATRCKLGDGKLGVCQADPQHPGAYTCASQH
jgi:hypothetical protein